MNSYFFLKPGERIMILTFITNNINPFVSIKAVEKLMHIHITDSKGVNHLHL